MSDDPLASKSAVGAATFAMAAPLAWPAEPRVAACMSTWLQRANDPNCADTQLFSKLIAERDARGELALLGLQQQQWDALLARHFARAIASRTASRLPLAVSVDASAHADFVQTLHALLVTHANPGVDRDDARELATIVAHACLRPDHLWRDLGLAGRDEVTWMLKRYFPTLVALNVANLRWKKFLAGQRAMSLGEVPGPAPGCPGCEDYGHCFPAPR